MPPSLVEVVVLDDSRKHLADGGPANLAGLSTLCDDVINEFSSSSWYASNVPYGPPDKFERAMLKTFVGWLITQRSRKSAEIESMTEGTKLPLEPPTTP